MAIKVGFKSGTCIKDIEMNRKYPGREMSQSLSQYFNLNTKYFYDEYLENTDQLHENLINYKKLKLPKGTRDTITPSSYLNHW